MNIQGALKGTNLRGRTEPKRRFSQIFADFCRFSPFPRKQSIWETQIFAETADFPRKPQIFAGTRRKPQIGVCPLRFVPLSAAPNIGKFCPLPLSTLIGNFRIYLWRRPRFLPTFFPFWKAKQHILAILRQKGKREGTKSATKIGRAFFGRKVHFFPSFKQNIA